MQEELFLTRHAIPLVAHQQDGWRDGMQRVLILSSQFLLTVATQMSLLTSRVTKELLYEEGKASSLLFHTI